MDSTPVLSVVVPVYNEEDVLPIMIPRLRRVLDGLSYRYEVVIVDDGSVDGGVRVVMEARKSWPQLRLIRLMRNSGHQAALTAGLHRAAGRYVVSMDADLQDPPEVIERMLYVAMTEDVDVVYGVRENRESDTPFKRWTAGLYYRLLGRLVGPRVPRHAGDFRLLSRSAVELLRQLPERTPILRLVVPWLGMRSAEVPYRRQPRAAGRTKYPLAKMVGLAADSVTSFSAAPLRAATWLGLGGIAVCTALGVAAFVAYAWGTTVPGWTSLYVVVLFLSGVQLLCLGLLGEYIGRIYTAILGRPAYIVATDSADDLTVRASVGGNGRVTPERAGALPGQARGVDR
jgi:glycosyltransferase involved in cell wall biosynthesis